MAYKRLEELASQSDIPVGNTDTTLIETVRALAREVEANSNSNSARPFSGESADVMIGTLGLVYIVVDTNKL